MHRELDTLCRRFEIAVGNFIRSCVRMRANECAFQAWYAASVIQEFGLARVYREIHLWKDELFELAGSERLTKDLESGNELFPDMSISWRPDIDARHSHTRARELREAGRMLSQFAVVSEFKVTGSTGKATPLSAIRRDLKKLGVFAGARRAFRSTAASPGPLAAYMVVLDNYTGADDKPKNHCSQAKLMHQLGELSEEWPIRWPKPTILVGCVDADSARVDVYREFRHMG